MTKSNQAFDRVGNDFIAYYDTVRGHVREQVTRHNLMPHLPRKSAKILDMGGGDGRDAVWLAKMGHKIVLVDPSEEMTRKAQHQANENGVPGLVEVRQAEDPEQALQGFDEEFDVVLSHGVLMYVNEPAQHLVLLGQVVREDGIISILTKGKEGSLLRLMERGDTAKAIELEKTNQLVNNLGEEVLAVSDDLMAQMLGETALRIAEWYGVRIVTDKDRRQHKEVPREELDSILKIEQRLSSEKSVRGMGQMLHFIARKKG